MKLKNVLITVKDMKKSIAFYKELVGLDVILEQDGNVILTEGLVLQERQIWEEAIDKKVIPYHHASELYFEEKQMDNFVEKLKKYKDAIEYVTEYREEPWGQKIVRFYDLDGNMIEVRTPM